VGESPINTGGSILAIFVPVAIKFGTEGHPQARLQALLDDDGFLEYELPNLMVDFRDLVEAKSDELVWPEVAGQTSHAVGQAVTLWSRPEEVTFLTDRSTGTKQFIFTAGSKLTTMELEVPAKHQWRDLHTIGLESAQHRAIRDAVRGYWRTRLMDTDAAREILPRYFTLRQLRSIYEAVWNRPLDASNFRKWVIHEDHTFIERVDDTSEITMRMRDELSDRNPEVGTSIIDDLLNGAESVGLSKKTVITSLGVLGVLGLAIPVMSAAWLVGGGVLAYQAGKHRGKPEDWYTFSDDIGKARPHRPFSIKPEWDD